MDSAIKLEEIPLTDEICGEIVYQQEDRNYLFMCTVCCDETFMDFSGFSQHYEKHHVSKSKKKDDSVPESEPKQIQASDLSPDESNISMDEDFMQFITLDDILNVSENLPPIILNLDDADIKLDNTNHTIISQQAKAVSNDKDDAMLPIIDPPPDEDDTFDIEEFIKFNDEMTTDSTTMAKIIMTPVQVDENYPCSVCGKVFKSKKALWDHSVYHKLLFKCDFCDKRFAKKLLLQRHSRTHTQDRPFKCDSCEKTFTTNESLTVHTRTHTGEKPFQCEYCNRSFPTSSARQVHHQRHLKICQFECELCKKGFVTKIALDVHMFTHKKKSFPCEHCGKLFENIWTKKSHETLHTQNKDQVCEVCGEKFLRRHTLVQHLKIHQDQREYECPFEGCGKKFKQLSTFYIHKNSHTNKKTTDTTKKRTGYDCDQCGQNFTKKVLFNQHKKIHSNGKKYRNEDDITDNLTEVQCVDVYTNN